MNLTTWLTVVLVCMLGAMSPGPSLAVVLRHTLNGGRRSGMNTALAHGLGVGLYALLSVLGLAAVITASPAAFSILQWGGAAYLVWLGIKGLRATPRATPAIPDTAGATGAARDGFLVAFLNPKVAVFFVALFSQLVGVNTGLAAKTGYAATAMVIDAGWYLSVAWLFSAPRWLARLQAHGVWFERIFGVILVGLAGQLVLGIVGGE